MNEVTRYAIVSTGGLVVGICFWGRMAEPVMLGFMVVQSLFAEIGWTYTDTGFQAPA
jgi:hypothetical protein